MEMTVFERMILLNVLPKEGDFTTLKIMRKMREDLSFTEDEHKALNFKFSGEKYKNENGEEVTVPEGNVHWETTDNITKDILFGEKATDLIVTTLKKLNTDKKLREEHFSLYEKFVEKE